jgi:Sec-independent protein translocase protein TatA
MPVMPSLHNRPDKFVGQTLVGMEMDLFGTSKITNRMEKLGMSFTPTQKMLSSLDTEFIEGDYKRELPTKSQYEAGLKADIDAANNKASAKSYCNSEYERQMSAVFENPPTCHVKEYADPDNYKMENSHDLIK